MGCSSSSHRHEGLDGGLRKASSSSLDRLRKSLSLPKRNKSIATNANPAEEEDTAAEVGQYLGQSLEMRLYEFYEMHDPQALRDGEIDVDQMAVWVRNTPQGLTALNKQLHTRYGVDLDDGDSDRRGSEVAAAAPPPPPAYDEEDDLDEDDDEEEMEEMIRNDLEKFFLLNAPTDLEKIDEFMEEYHAKGKIALNVTLYRMYHKNLDTMREEEEERASVATPMSGRRSTTHFGVQIASDDMLREMRIRQETGRRLTAVKPIAPKPKQRVSSVSDSLERKWKKKQERSASMVPEEIPASSPASPQQSTPKVSSSLERKWKARETKNTQQDAKPANSSDNCTNFVLDMEAEQFGVCKNCGKPRGAHMAKPANVSGTLERKWKQK